MYKTKYVSKTKVYKGKEAKESYLDVRFNFWDETAPKDRPFVRKRRDSLYSKMMNHLGNSELKILDKYLKIKEIEYSGFASKRFKLGLSISISFKGKPSLEEMFDLDAIDNYVLDGIEPEDNKNN